MSDRPIVVLDGAGFSTLDGFYDEVNRLLAPSIRMGRNLDAWNDVLRGDLGGPEGEFDLVWRASAKSRQDFGYDATVRELETKLERCHPTASATVAYELERARKGEGPTLFDWLVEVVSWHPHVSLRLE